MAITITITTTAAPATAKATAEETKKILKILEPFNEHGKTSSQNTYIRTNEFFGPKNKINVTLLIVSI